MTGPVSEPQADSQAGIAAALRGFGVLSAANIVGQALGFAALSIVTRRIGASAVGNYNFAVSLAAYFGLLANAGVSYVAFREVTLDPSRLSPVLSESLSLQGIGAAIGYLLLVAASHWITPNRAAGSLVPIVGVTLIVSAVTVDGVLLALRSRIPVAVARVGGQVVYAALVPVLVTRTSGPSPYAWLNVLGLAVTAVIVGGVLWRKRVWRFIPPRPIALWRRLRRSAAIGYSLAMIQLYSRADILLLGYLSTPRQVGFYAVANRLPSSLLGFANLWLQAVFPHAATTIRDDLARFRAETSRVLTAAAVLALAITCGAAMFPARLMAAMFGGAFHASGWPFAILAAAMALVLVEAVLSNILIASSRDRRYAQIVTIGACVNLALNLVLIPSLASSGSALATLVTEALLIALTLVAARPVVGLPRLDVSRLARGVAAVVLMCAVMAAVGTFSVWLAVAAGAAVFVGASAAFRVFDPALWRRRQ
jgi:O-antigen/teichoic acid export membrane protein